MVICKARFKHENHGKKQTSQDLSEKLFKRVRFFGSIIIIVLCLCFFFSRAAEMLCEFAHFPSLKLTFSHLKIDGWKTILSFWVSAYSLGLSMLVIGVYFLKIHGFPTEVHGVRIKTWKARVFAG